MRKKEVLTILLILMVIFVSVSQVFAQSIMLSKTEIKEDDSAVKILFSTSKTIPIECYDLSTPPQIVVDFMGEIYTDSPEIVLVNKGLVKQLRIIKGTRKDPNLGEAFYSIDFIIVDLQEIARYDFDLGLSTAVLVISKPGKKLDVSAANKAVSELKEVPAKEEPAMTAQATTIETVPIAAQRNEQTSTAGLSEEKEQEYSVEQEYAAMMEKEMAKEAKEPLISEKTVEPVSLKAAETPAQRTSSRRRRVEVAQKETREKPSREGSGRRQRRSQKKADISGSEPKTVGEGVSGGFSKVGKGLKDFFTFGEGKKSSKETARADAERESLRTRKRGERTSVQKDEKAEKPKSEAVGRSRRKREVAAAPVKAQTREPVISSQSSEVELAIQRVAEIKKEISDMTNELVAAGAELEKTRQDEAAASKDLSSYKNKIDVSKKTYENSLSELEIAKKIANSNWIEYTNAKTQLSTALDNNLSDKDIDELQKDYDRKKVLLESAIKSADEVKEISDAQLAEYYKAEEDYEKALSLADGPKQKKESANIYYNNVIKDIKLAKEDLADAQEALSDAERESQRNKLHKAEEDYKKSLMEIDSTIVKKTETPKTVKEEVPVYKVEGVKPAEKEPVAAGRRSRRSDSTAQQPPAVSAPAVQKAAENKIVRHRRGTSEAASSSEVKPDKEKTAGSEVLKTAVELRNAGLEMQRIGDLDNAVKYYQQALMTDPNYATAHNDLGILYEQKGLDEKAKMEYLAALKIDPYYTKAHSNLALLYEKSGDNNKAYYHWKQRVQYGKADDPWTSKAREHMEMLEQRK